MKDIDLDELERLANQAVPGPWEIEEGGEAVFSSNKSLPEGRAYGYHFCRNNTMTNFVCDLNDGEYHEYDDIEEQKNTALYIAAMSPVTAKALIARIRELEEQVAYPSVGTCAECTHWGAPWEKKEDDPKHCTMMETGICMDGELERDDTLAKGYGNNDADSGWVETKASFSCCMFERKEK